MSSWVISQDRIVDDIAALQSIFINLHTTIATSRFARQLGQSHSDMCVNAISQYFIVNKMCFVICVCVLIVATTSVRSPKIHSHGKMTNLLLIRLNALKKIWKQKNNVSKTRDNRINNNNKTEYFVAQLRLNRNPIRHTTPVNRSHFSLALSLIRSFSLA